MKRLHLIIVAVAFLSCFSYTNSFGQDIVNLRHIVQRGETIETLADKYRLTTDILKAVNLGMDTFYTGMEVSVPVDKKYLLLTKAKAYQTVQQASSGMYDKELGISGNSSAGPKKKTASGFVCSICRDSRICQTCNGSGWQSGMGDNHDHYGAGINKIPCGNCSNGRSKGDGICHYCK